MHDPELQSQWYFAYGANMSFETLKRRGVNPIRSVSARLDGYALKFSHRGLLFTEPAFANLEADAHGVVYGVAHELGPGELERLDKIEGAEYQHVDVMIEAEVGPLQARAYLDPYPVSGLKPSRRYARVCIEAARHHHLPAAYIEALISHPTCHIPIASEVTTLLVGVAERARRAGLRPEVLRMRRLGQQPRERR